MLILLVTNPVSQEETSSGGKGMAILCLVYTPRELPFCFRPEATRKSSGRSGVRKPPQDTRQKVGKVERVWGWEKGSGLLMVMRTPGVNGGEVKRETECQGYAFPDSVRIKKGCIERRSDLRDDYLKRNYKTSLL
jgi:hypothetical protein